jgi:hypothetical protein
VLGGEEVGEAVGRLGRPDGGPGQRSGHLAAVLQAEELPVSVALLQYCIVVLYY